MEDRIRKFAKLVDEGSFTKAAKALHISQPALSIAIAKLERELKCELIIRDGKNFQVTPAGLLARESAKQLTAHIANLKSSLAEVNSAPQPLSIGMIDGVASLFFASKLPIERLERYAHISVAVHNSRNLIKEVSDGNLDVAFIVARHGALTEVLQAVPVAAEPLVLVCHKKQQATMQSMLRQGVLPRAILYDDGSTTRQLIEATLQREHVTPYTTFSSTSPEVMLRLVLLQKGAAVLPYTLIGDHLKKGIVVPLGVEQPLFFERPIVRIALKERTTTVPIERITQDIASQLEGIYNEAQGLQKTIT